MIPRRPWVFSSQYGLKFVLSQDNEIILGSETCKKVPEEILAFIIKAVNEHKEPAPQPAGEASTTEAQS